jgi:hypothetical protein
MRKPANAAFAVGAYLRCAEFGAGIIVERSRSRLSCRTVPLDDPEDRILAQSEPMTDFASARSSLTL